jgi:alpha-1,2-mannosyltransferase
MWFLVVLLIAVPLAPILFKHSFILSLRILGQHLQKKSQKRKRYVLASVKAEIQAQKTPDKDWGKVDGYGKTGQKTSNEDWDGVVGFFHPFCAAGGGGERVLWAAILATQKRWPKATCVVYSGDHDVDRNAMIEKARSSFGISLNPATLHISYLSTRRFVLANTYPSFTLLGQSLGSLALAYDAFSLITPDIFIDTMGYAFTLAFCKYLFPSVPTAAYVHYPTISTDMLDSLDDTTGIRGVNSGAGVGLRGKVKKMYWRLFARLYGWVGGKIDVVMCNSSWTRSHITALWKKKSSKSSFAAVVYPPCPVEVFENRIDVSAASESKREHMLLYIAQFRQEKNHTMILNAFAKYYHALSEDERKDAKLVLMGSVRANTPDETHIYKLRLDARGLGIEPATEFVTNASFSAILDRLQKASIGVNGMWNEHFGIGVVEYHAAGLIPVVHNSGGPKLDIVIPYGGEPTGYHAETEEQFAEAFRRVTSMSREDTIAMRLRGRANAKRFTEEVFAEKWVSEMDHLIEMQVVRSRRRTY